MSRRETIARAFLWMTFEKCVKAQYCPLRVSCPVLESMVTKPPQLKGPMFGLPASSKRKFQPTTHSPQFLSTLIIVSDHFVQSVAYSPPMVGPPSVHNIFFVGKASCTWLIASGVPM